MRDIYYTQVRQDDSLPENEFRAVISNDSVDRHGTVVNPDGLDVEQFLRAPTLLYQHEMGQLPIGRVLSLTRVDNEWQAHFRVDGDTELERVIISKLNSGSLHSVSIGFRPFEQDYEEDYVRIKSAELVELSVVTVGSNKDALVTSRSLVEDHMEKKDLNNRAGAVLSKANKKCLRKAKDEIEKVLNTGNKEDKKEKEDEKDGERTIKKLKAEIKELKSEIRRLEDQWDDDEIMNTMAEELNCKSDLKDERFIDEVFRDLESLRDRDGSLADIDLDDLEF